MLFRSAADRLAGYKAALEECGISVEQTGVREGTFRLESGYEAAKSLALSSFRPSAIFVTNNMMSLGAVSALHELELRIPDDISLVGFDDSELLSLCAPPLTVISQSDQSDFGLGVSTGSLLLERIEGRRRERKVIVHEPALVVRRSCKRAD